MEVSDPSGEEIHFAWKSFDADLREVTIPMGAAAATTPPRIALAKVGLTGPSILYTQPSPALQELLAGQQPEEEAAAEQEEAAEKEAPPEEPAPAGPKPEITIERFELRGGDVRFNDNAVKPPYRGVIEGLELTAQGIDAMAPSAEKLVVDSKLPGGARLDVDGKVGATDGALRLDVKRMDLPPVNPSLSDENQVHLRRYLAQLEVPDERYDELARARAVQRVILETERIDASRVELADPGRGTPGVGFDFDAIPLPD